MEILILGSGAREHALAWRLARDEGVGRVRIAAGNGGTPACAETSGPSAQSSVIGSEGVNFAISWVNRSTNSS